MYSINNEDTSKGEDLSTEKGSPTPQNLEQDVKNIRDKIIKENGESQKNAKRLRAEKIRAKVISHSEVEASRNQGVHPLDVLKLDIWLLLMDKYVTNPRDWLNFYHASKILRKDFAFKWEETVISRLLPEVLNILDSQPKHQMCLSSLLDLRLVCKGWRRSTDYFLQHHPNRHNFFPSSALTEDQKDWATNSDRKCITDSLKFFIPNHSVLGLNPFPSRQLVVRNIGYQYFPLPLPELDQVVELFGTHIWYFTYYCEPTHLPTEWYSFLRSWLLKMPNLKMVGIFLRVDGATSSKYQDSVKMVEEEVVILPFPKLEKMVTFKSCDAPFGLVNSALRENPQLERVKIHHYKLSDEHHAWNGYDSFPGEHLIDLSISLNFCKKGRLDQLRLVNWPLRQLKIRSSSLKLNVGMILPILDHFKSTLVNLELDEFVWNVTTQLEGFHLSLPHLEHFRLSLAFGDYWDENVAFDGENVSFDFLLKLASLKTFFLQCDGKESCIEKKKPDEVIQCMGYFESLYKSEIWNLLPSLDRVELRIKSLCQMYSRDAYNNQKKNQ